MNFVTEVMMSEIEQASQLMKSVEADLVNSEWKFHAPDFRAGAGDYLIISKRDWEWIKARFTPERTAPVSAVDKRGEK